MLAASRCCASTNEERSARPWRRSAVGFGSRLCGIALSRSINSVISPACGSGVGSAGGSESIRASSRCSGAVSFCPSSHSGAITSPTTTLSTIAPPCRTRSWRRVVASDSHMAATSARLEAGADRLDDHLAGAVEVVLAGRDQLEDPAREQLLDRPVEPHRDDLRVEVGAELARLLRVADDLRDPLVGAADLRE